MMTVMMMVMTGCTLVEFSIDCVVSCGVWVDVCVFWAVDFIRNEVVCGFIMM